MVYDFYRLLYFFVQLGTCLRLMEECFSVSPLFFLSFLFPLSRFLYTALLQILSSFFLRFIRDGKKWELQAIMVHAPGITFVYYKITFLFSIFYLSTIPPNACMSFHDSFVSQISAID